MGLNGTGTVRHLITPATLGSCSGAGRKWISDGTVSIVPARSAPARPSRKWRELSAHSVTIGVSNTYYKTEILFASAVDKPASGHSGLTGMLLRQAPRLVNRNRLSLPSPPSPFASRRPLVLVTAQGRAAKRP